MYVFYNFGESYRQVFFIPLKTV